jgi:pimeloyl-ACP methyl ester carboxylesterase
VPDDRPRTVRVDSAHELSVEVTGADDGFPIVLMHGTPGSRTGPKPRSIQLYRMGVRLICYDRPGYGRSTARKGRTVADAATDVRAIVDDLGVKEFAIVGRSGGGPHALACAASDLLAGRVLRAAILVSLAPADAQDLDWYGDMNSANVKDFQNAAVDPETLARVLGQRVRNARRDPGSIVESLQSDLTPYDRKIIEDVAMRKLLEASYTEALRHSARGWIDDVLALRSAWEFKLAAVTAPVRVWHGAQDTFSPAAHARWLVSQMPNAKAQVEQNASHFSAMPTLPNMLAWLAGARYEVDAPAPV